MPGDATPPPPPPPPLPPPELPPGLLAEYLESARAQLGVLAGLAERLLAASGGRGAPAAAPPGTETPDSTPCGAARANCLSPVASETGDALAERAGGARRRIGRRRPGAGGDLRGGRRGARRAARVRVARARVSVFGVS